MEDGKYLQRAQWEKKYTEYSGHSTTHRVHPQRENSVSNEDNHERVAAMWRFGLIGALSLDEKKEELGLIDAEASVQEYENVVNMLPEGPEKAAALERLAEVNDNASDPISLAASLAFVCSKNLTADALEKANTPQAEAQIEARKHEPTPH